jgi:hypothetical protein
MSEIANLNKVKKRPVHGAHSQNAFLMIFKTLLCYLGGQW